MRRTYLLWFSPTPGLAKAVEPDLLVVYPVMTFVILLYLPAIVLSRRNADIPPTNILVLRRTVNIWSTARLPEGNRVIFMKYYLGTKQTKKRILCLY